jgi:hypothetical protein
MKNNTYKTLIDNISFSFKDYFHAHKVRQSIDDIFLRLNKNSPETLQKLYKEISLKHISSIRIVDSHGSSITLLHKGSPHNKKICIRTNLDPGKNINAIKTLILNEIIKNDIKRTLIESEARTGRKKPLHAIMFGKNYQEKTTAAVSSSFENQYKSFLRTHGTYVHPLAAAKTILKTMTAQDKALLNMSLESKGIKTVQDFTRILQRWELEVVQEKPEKKRSYSYSLEM